MRLEKRVVKTANPENNTEEQRVTAPEYLKQSVLLHELIASASPSICQCNDQSESENRNIFATYARSFHKPELLHSAVNL